MGFILSLGKTKPNILKQGFLMIIRNRLIQLRGGQDIGFAVFNIHPILGYRHGLFFVVFPIFLDL